MDLCQSVRFCDMFSYADTISVSVQLVQDSKKFFDTMSNMTSGYAFTRKCCFEFDKDLGIHVIEQPSWFNPDRFHCYASWIASIIEENLWAHYNYHLANLNKVNVDLKYSTSLDYLFDKTECKEMVVSEVPSAVNVDELTNAWLNASHEQKQEVAENLKMKIKEVPSKTLKQKYIKTEYFIHDYSF